LTNEDDESDCVDVTVQVAAVTVARTCWPREQPVAAVSSAGCCWQTPTLCAHLRHRSYLLNIFHCELPTASTRLIFTLLNYSLGFAFSKMMHNPQSELIKVTLQ